MGADITYVQLRRGLVHLVAPMDWLSRYVLSWELSVTLHVGFCLAVLELVLSAGKPEIFNSDQGSQFPSNALPGMLPARDVQISIDGRGRATDNTSLERLWRRGKCEKVYLKDYEDVPHAIEGLPRHFLFYNRQQMHQSLGYRTPEQVHSPQRLAAKHAGRHPIISFS